MLDTILSAAAALALGAMGYWYMKPLGTRLKAGDTALVTEVIVGTTGSFLRAPGERRFIIKVNNPDPKDLRGVIVGVEGTPPEGGAQSFLTFLKSALNQNVTFTVESVTGAERNGSSLSGSV